jgi:hypothetical protein
LKKVLGFVALDYVTIVSNGLQKQDDSCGHADNHNNIAPAVAATNFTTDLENDTHNEKDNRGGPFAQLFNEYHGLLPDVKTGAAQYPRPFHILTGVSLSQ